MRIVTKNISSVHISFFKTFTFIILTILKRLKYLIDNKFLKFITSILPILIQHPCRLHIKSKVPAKTQQTTPRMTMTTIIPTGELVDDGGFGGLKN